MNVGFGQIRSQGDGAPARFKRVLPAAHRDEHASACAVGFGEFRLQRYGAGVAFLRFRQPPQQAQRFRHVEVSHRRVRRDFQRPPDQLHRSLHVAALSRQHAQIVQCVRVVRLECKDLAISRIGLKQPSRAMVGDRLFDRHELIRTRQGIRR